MRKAVIAVALLLLMSSAAFAKMEFAKATGYKCTDCHVSMAKTKEPNPDNKLWATAKKYSDQIAKNEGPAAGKTCNDCHQGQHVPPKK